MLYFNDNIYHVKGIVGSTIYNSSTGDIYHLNKETSELIEKITTQETKLSNNENEFVEKMLSLDLLTYQYKKNKNIHELAVNNDIDFVWIEITTGCNLKCIHCYDEANYCNIKNMSYKDFCYIIDQLVVYGIKKIQLIGGEPFIIGEKLKLYLDYAIGKFEYIEIFTNGTLINEEWLSYLSENKIKLALSVYSYDEFSHDYVTKVTGSWKKTNTIIEKICKYNISYRVKNVLIKNVEIGEKNTSLYTLSHKKDVVRMVGRADFSLISKENLIKRLITKKSFSHKLSKEYISRLLSGHNCFSRRLYFSVDLNVYPCVMEKRFCHGNLKNKEISDILNRDILTLSKDSIEECSKCEFRYYCFDCRPDAMNRGKLSKPWYCTYDVENGQWLNTDDVIKTILGK